MKLKREDGHLIAYLGWRDVEDGVRQISDSLRSDDKVPDAVVGILRGGCVPAVWLAHDLEVDAMFAVAVRTTLDDTVRAPRLRPEIAQVPDIRGPYMSMLLVDDVVNSGATLRAVKSHFGVEMPNLTTAALAWDTVGQEGATCAAEYVAFHVPSWVSFPWERQPRRRSRQ